MLEENKRREIGKRVQDLRIRCGYSQDQLAEMIDLTSKHIQSLENGRRGLTTDNLIELTIIFNVSADYLLFGYDKSVEAGSAREYLKAIYEGADDEMVPYFVDGAIFVTRIRNRKNADFANGLNSNAGIIG